MYATYGHAEAPGSPMQQPCDDVEEHPPEGKGKPTEGLYAVCGHGAATLPIHPSEAVP